MANNIEEFRSKFLTAARNRLLSYNSLTATEAELVIQSAVLKAYDLVDQYQALTPERTSMMLAMTQPEFNLWLSDPVDAVRNRIAFAKTLSVPEAAAIIYADATATANIVNSQIALATIQAAPEAFALLLNSAAAMQAIATNPTALSLFAENAVAMATLANSEAAMQVIAAIPTAMATLANSKTAMQALAASATAMQAIAASQAAMQAIVASSKAIEAVTLSSIAMAAIAANQAAISLAVATPAIFTSMVYSDEAMAEIAKSATALHAIAKNPDARVSFAGSSLLQNYAPTISATLDKAAGFIQRANSAVMVGVRDGVYGLVGGETYTATTGAINSLAAGAYFVYVKTMGSASGTNPTSSQIHAKHMQTGAIAGSKPHNGGAHNVQAANFLCVGGMILDGSNITSPGATAGMTFSCWEAL